MQPIPTCADWQVLEITSKAYLTFKILSALPLTPGYHQKKDCSLFQVMCKPAGAAAGCGSWTTYAYIILRM